MESLILCTIFGVFIIFSFIVGLHYGSKVRDNEKITIPNINPVKAIKKHRKDKREEERIEHEKLIEEINLENIESYDGTGSGQKEIPKR